jgi:hypothetical protein
MNTKRKTPSKTKNVWIDLTLTLPLLEKPPEKLTKPTEPKDKPLSNLKEESLNLSLLKIKNLLKLEKLLLELGSKEF